MSKSLLARAGQKIASQQASNRRSLAVRKAREADLIGKGSAVGGSLAAAYIDSEYADEQSGEPPEKFGVPVSGAVGLGLAVVSCLPKGQPGMARTAVGGLGVGMVCASVYRFAYDKLEDKK